MNDRKVAALPATAQYGQVITVRDGVAYLALRPLPAADLGRDAAITLTPGVPQRRPIMGARASNLPCSSMRIFTSGTRRSAPPRCRNSRTPRPVSWSRWAT